MIHLFYLFRVNVAFERTIHKKHRYRMRWIYLDLHCFTRPRLCIYSKKKFIKAKNHWRTNRQDSFQRRRQKCQELLEKRRRLTAIRLAGPGMISSCGVHPTLGCDLIDDRMLKPEIHPDDGTPITLGQGVSGTVELLRHTSGYLLASKSIVASSYDR